MLQFGSKHVCIGDVHIFKHCHEMTLFLLWIGTYCISYVVQQTSRVKDLSSLVRYDDSCLAAIRYVQSIIPVVRPRPNTRSNIVLFAQQSDLFPRFAFRQVREREREREKVPFFIVVSFCFDLFFFEFAARIFFLLFSFVSTVSSHGSPSLESLSLETS